MQLRQKPNKRVYVNNFILTDKYYNMYSPFTILPFRNSYSKKNIDKEDLDAIGGIFKHPQYGHPVAFCIFSKYGVNSGCGIFSVDGLFSDIPSLASLVEKTLKDSDLDVGDNINLTYMKEYIESLKEKKYEYPKKTIVLDYAGDLFELGYPCDYDGDWNKMIFKKCKEYEDIMYYGHFISIDSLKNNGIIECEDRRLWYKLNINEFKFVFKPTQQITPEQLLNQWYKHRFEAMVQENNDLKFNLTTIIDELMNYAGKKMSGSVLDCKTRVKTPAKIPIGLWTWNMVYDKIVLNGAIETNESTHLVYRFAISSENAPKIFGNACSSKRKEAYQYDVDDIKVQYSVNSELMTITWNVKQNPIEQIETLSRIELENENKMLKKNNLKNCDINENLTEHIISSCIICLCNLYFLLSFVYFVIVSITNNKLI